MTDATSFDFRAWMQEQEGPYEADFADPDHIRLESDYAVAQINFYDMAPDPEIVEFHIENKADGETKFFLHFHATEREHACGLFREMVEALVALRDEQTTEILLCCTAGMTTSFFADRMNQVTEALGLDWSFSAVSVNEVYEHGADKAAILVAPQIGYMADRVAEVMRDVPVLRIPTAVFASYDAAGCVEFVREELARRAQEAEERATAQLTCEDKAGRRILAIAASLDGKGAVVHYRLYDHGEVALSEQVIKRRLTLRDLTDIIDTQVCACSGRVDADAVGIALPGVLHDGVLELPPRRTHDLARGKDSFAIADYFAERRDLLPDMEEVAAELAKYVPRELQPRLVHVDDLYEPILLGAMLFCQEKLEG